MSPSNLINLTNIEGSGGPLLINPDAIASITDTGKGARITLVSGKEHYCQETPAQVQAAIAAQVPAA